MSTLQPFNQQHRVKSAAVKLPQRRRIWPFLLALCLLILLASATTAYIMLNRKAEKMARERMHRLAARYGLKLQIGEFDLRPLTGTLELKRVRVLDGYDGRVLFAGNRIVGRFTIDGWTDPRVTIERVLFSGGRVELPEGREQLKSLLKRFRSRRKAKDSKRRSSSRRRLLMQGVRLEFDNIQIRRGERTLASFSGQLTRLFGSAPVLVKFDGWMYPDRARPFKLRADLDKKTRNHHGVLTLPQRVQMSIRGRQISFDRVQWSSAVATRLLLRGIVVDSGALGLVKSKQLSIDFRPIDTPSGWKFRITTLELNEMVANLALPRPTNWRHALVDFMSRQTVLEPELPQPKPGQPNARRLFRRLSRYLDLSNIRFKFNRGRVNLMRSGSKEPWYYLHSMTASLTRKKGNVWSYRLDTALTSQEMNSAVINLTGSFDTAKKSMLGTVRLDEFTVPTELTKRRRGFEIQGKPEVDLKARIVARLKPLHLSIKGSLNVKGLTVRHRMVAEEPMKFKPLHVKGGLTFDRNKERIELSAASFKYGEITGSAGLTVRFNAIKPVLTGFLKLPEQDCHKAIHSIPRPLLPKLELSRFSGVGAMDIQARVDWNNLRSRRTWISIKTNVERCRALTLGPEVQLWRLKSSNFVHRVTHKDKTIKVGPGTGEWFSLRKMPQFIPVGAILTEDRAFHIHEGINVNLIRRALILNLERHRFVYGGSTISQQLVKNLFLYRHKTLARKLAEVIITWQMERRLSKDRIMELYLNCIEYGPGIYGIRDAAKRYFGKKVDELTPLETSFLMGLKPSPKAGWYQFRRGVVNNRWQRKLKKIMHRMHDYKVITKEELENYAPYKLNFKLANLHKKPVHQKGADAKEPPTKLKNPYL